MAVTTTDTSNNVPKLLPNLKYGSSQYLVAIEENAELINDKNISVNCRSVSL